ncbi:MAG TPA: hypothetical protein VFS43_31355 [Polyangiaceae bacterium]|nr:hypothetical protein [Polyangiaceae bacterium]
MPGSVVPDLLMSPSRLEPVAVVDGVPETAPNVPPALTPPPTPPPTLAVPVAVLVPRPALLTAPEPAP